MALSGGSTVAPFAGAKVLVVEDEVVVALELEATLREVGCTPLGPVASIADALATLKADRPDAVLLDLGLTDGRATPVAEALASAGVPFAVMTGFDAMGLKGVLKNGAPAGQAVLIWRGPAGPDAAVGWQAGWLAEQLKKARNRAHRLAAAVPRGSLDDLGHRSEVVGLDDYAERRVPSLPRPLRLASKKDACGVMAVAQDAGEADPLSVAGEVDVHESRFGALRRGDLQGAPN